MTNDVEAMHDGQVVYNLMCYPNGGVVDDLLVYRFSRTRYLLVINAANVETAMSMIAGTARSMGVIVGD